MNNRLFLNILRFIGLALLQVMVIDNIRLGYYIHPCVYVLFIFLLPFNIPQWQLLLTGFAMGFTIDIFNGTPGLNAAATVLLAFIRPMIINAMTRRKDINPNDEPSIRNMGVSWFLVYSSLLLCFHNLTLFALEAFSIKLMNKVILQTLLSVISSLSIILLIVLIFKKNHRKSL